MLCHDPRLTDDRSKKVKTNNASLINAEVFRKKWPNHKIDWDKVARFADQCDQILNKIRNDEILKRKRNAKKKI